jgi:putative sigma-54 modulation protein
MIRMIIVDAPRPVELFGKQSKDADQRAVVQMTLSVNGALLRSEEKAADFYTAVDSAADVLDRQIERYKGKLYGRHKPGAAARTGLARRVSLQSPEAETAPEAETRVRRVKVFRVEPMDEEEAMERMELLDHDFFVFLNVATNRLGIVYRRKDGNYGLLDPQVP